MSQASVNRYHHEALSAGHRAGQALAGKHQVANSILYMYIIADKRLSQW